MARSNPISAYAVFIKRRGKLSARGAAGISFRPGLSFFWPEEGGTLTFYRPLYLEGDWEIPANVTLNFPKDGCWIINTNSSETHTVTINGPIQVTDQGYGRFIRSCNVVLNSGGSVLRHQWRNL